MNDGLNILYFGMSQAVQHPLFYCIVVVMLTQIGYLLGSLQITIAFYTVLQIICVAVITAGVLVWLWNQEIRT